MEREKDIPLPPSTNALSVRAKLRSSCASVKVTILEGVIQLYGKEDDLNDAEALISHLATEGALRQQRKKEMVVADQDSAPLIPNDSKNKSFDSSVEQTEDKPQPRLGSSQSRSRARKQKKKTESVSQTCRRFIYFSVKRKNVVRVRASEEAQHHIWTIQSSTKGSSYTFKENDAEADQDLDEMELTTKATHYRASSNISFSGMALVVVPFFKPGKFIVVDYGKIYLHSQEPIEENKVLSLNAFMETQNNAGFHQFSTKILTEQDLGAARAWCILQGYKREADRSEYCIFFTDLDSTGHMSLTVREDDEVPPKLSYHSTRDAISCYLTPREDSFDCRFVLKALTFPPGGCAKTEQFVHCLSKAVRKEGIHFSWPTQAKHGAVRSTMHELVELWSCGAYTLELGKVTQVWPNSKVSTTATYLTLRFLTPQLNCGKGECCETLDNLAGDAESLVLCALHAERTLVNDRQSFSMHSLCTIC